VKIAGLGRILDVRGKDSCYVTIGDYTFYLELSEATSNRPYISYWKEDWEDDRVITLNG